MTSGHATVCMTRVDQLVRYEGDITTVDIDIIRCYITHERWLHCSGGLLTTLPQKYRITFNIVSGACSVVLEDTIMGLFFANIQSTVLIVFGFIVFNALHCISFSLSATVYSGFINDSQSDDLDFNDSNHSTTVFNQSRVLLSFAASLASS